LLGVSLETPLKQLFATPLVAAGFLVVNGSILLLGEALRRRAHTLAVNATTARQGEPAVSRAWEPLQRSVGMPNVATLEHSPDPQTRSARSLASLSWKEALLVGLAQSLALIPGISRSGTTMVAGLGVGLSHEDAARYSFLLGTPLIGAAALLEVPQLFGLPVATLGLVLLGMGVAGVAAYLSTKFLLKYFETGRLHPFAYYCWGAGLLSLILFLTIR
jgi:undecaprenyl-diphosphatase